MDYEGIDLAASLGLKHVEIRSERPSALVPAEKKAYII
jgi:hypothetical protein